MNHKQALILFWSLVCIMVSGFTIALTNFIHGQLSTNNMELVWFVFFACLTTIPVVILIPMIGGGKFESKRQNSNLSQEDKK